MSGFYRDSRGSVEGFVHIGVYIHFIGLGVYGSEGSESRILGSGWKAKASPPDAHRRFRLFGFRKQAGALNPKATALKPKA